MSSFKLWWAKLSLIDRGLVIVCSLVVIPFLLLSFLMIVTEPGDFFLFIAIPFAGTIVALLWILFIYSILRVVGWFITSRVHKDSKPRGRFTTTINIAAFLFFLLIGFIWSMINGPYSAGHLRYQYFSGTRNFASVSMPDADFSNARLPGIYWQLGNLKGANLTGADLSGGNLSLANLEGTDLSGTDLTAVYMGGANLCQAIIDDQTKMKEKDWLIWEIINHG